MHLWLSIVIIAVFRSPSGQKAEFCEALNEFLDIVRKGNYEIVIAGDLNIDWYRDYYRTRLVSILDDNGLKQIVNEFTRITQTSIDYRLYYCQYGQNYSHEWIDILIEVGNECHAPENKECCKLGSMVEFKEMDDLDEYVGKFDWCLDNTVKHFTVRSRINREKRNEWLNSELRALRRHKIIKYKIHYGEQY